ncbi:hypothetical protein BDW22DRAFT_1364639 [Trametopsis cervina]|nr:hypothetical protein BDW22DRAFT_1364639 [Trametopsis cervina]
MRFCYGSGSKLGVRLASNAGSASSAFISAQCPGYLGDHICSPCGQFKRARARAPTQYTSGYAVPSVNVGIPPFLPAIVRLSLFLLRNKMARHQMKRQYELEIPRRNMAHRPIVSATVGRNPSPCTKHADVVLQLVRARDAVELSLAVQKGVWTVL